MSDRLLLSEAIDAVSRMIRGYANSGSAGKSYIGAIAELLMRYPRQVALKCADPFGGVPRETKFLPTPADIIAWCEREQMPLHEEATREERIAEQLRLREEWQNSTPDERLKKAGQAWLDRTDPAARALTGIDDPQANAEAVRKREAAEELNRAFFLRECQREGIDPAGGVSPSLRKLLGEQHAATQS